MLLLDVGFETLSRSVEFAVRVTFKRPGWVTTTSNSAEYAPRRPVGFTKSSHSTLVFSVVLEVGEVLTSSIVYTALPSNESSKPISSNPVTASPLTTTLRVSPT